MSFNLQPAQPKFKRGDFIINKKGVIFRVRHVHEEKYNLLALNNHCVVWYINFTEKLYRKLTEEEKAQLL